MLKISSKNTFILKEVAQPYRSDQILHMQLQQEALSTTCLGLPRCQPDVRFEDVFKFLKAKRASSRDFFMSTIGKG